MGQTKKPSWKKRLLIGVAIVLAVLLILVGAGIGIIYHYIGKIDIDTPDDIASNDYIVTSIEDEPEESIDPDIPSATDSEIANLESTFDWLDDVEINDSDKVINILLIGTDGRSLSQRGRSDSMILVSLNKITKKIYLTSIMRDTYVKIPGVSKLNRINAAYAYGGASLLMKTVEQHFKVKVDKYVRVNFESFKTVIDYLGGVEMTVTDGEAGHIDGIDKAGTYLLNGAQALQYARMRHIGHGDFDRTNRQRIVLDKLIEKCKGMSIGQLAEVLDFTLPNVSTNMSKNEMLGHILMSPTYFTYEIVSQRVPYGDRGDSWRYAVYDNKAVLEVDFEKNIEFLKSTIYEGVE